MSRNFTQSKRISANMKATISGHAEFMEVKSTNIIVVAVRNHIVQSVYFSRIEQTKQYNLLIKHILLL
jgi:hypothetical protein